MTSKQFMKLIINQLAEDDAVALFEDDGKGKSMVVVLDSGERFKLAIRKLANMKH